jgi:hypothetical protein
MMMDLAKLNEGFMKPATLRGRFERLGVNLREKNSLSINPTHIVDPLILLDKLVVISTKPDEILSSPPPSPYSPISYDSASPSPFSLSSLDKISRSQSSSPANCAAEVTSRPSSVTNEDYCEKSTTLTIQQLNKLTENNSKLLRKLSLGYNASVEIVPSRCLFVRGDMESCQLVMKRVESLETDSSRIINGTLFIPENFSPSILAELKNIAAYSNCTLTPLNHGNGNDACYLFVNSSLEWNVRKCIDGFKDFEKSQKASKASCPGLAVKSTDVHSVVYDRFALLRIREKVKSDYQIQLVETLEKDILL